MEEALLDKMNEFLSVSSVPDEDDLPFEPFDAFSTEPVEFGEMAGRMMVKVENIFDLTRVYNRHSAKYLKACALLERGIRQLGSACVTRSALEANNQSFPELNQLTTQKLYRMASFNYRKLDTAHTEKLKQGNDLYPELTDMVFRYFTLLRRLRATEGRIHAYFNKKYFGEEDFKPVIEGVAFSKKSWTKSYTSDREEAPAFRNAPAYPVIKNSEFRNQNSEIRTRDSAGKDQGARIEDQGDGGSGAGIQNSEIRIQKSEDRAPEVKDSGAGIQDPVAVNLLPEGNRDQGTRLEDQGSGGSEPESLGWTPVSMETPKCVEIVVDAVMRSGTPDGSVEFTEEELAALNSDPNFDQIFPDLAEKIRQDSGFRSQDSGFRNRDSGFR